MAMTPSTPPPDTASREGNTIRAVIYTEPIPQPRQRHSVSRQTGFVRNYTPARHPVNALKKRIRETVQRVMKNTEGLWTGGVFLRAIFQFPRPKNKVWKTKPMPSYPHAIKPDLDNLAKAVMDALTGVLYLDDSQIVGLTLTKIVASGDMDAPNAFPMIRIIAEHFPVAD